MRLFTAITFDKKIREEIYEIIEMLRSYTSKGSFTIEDNLHLTLNFIGETDRLEDVKRAMLSAVEKTKTPCFDLRMEGFGRFKRREGDICFLDVKEEEHLFHLQKGLVSALKANDFAVDDGSYKPHITLARRAVFSGEFDEKNFGISIPEIKQSVRKISLMKSERIRGKLVYSEIFHVDLK